MCCKIKYECCYDLPPLLYTCAIKYSTSLVTIFICFDTQNPITLHVSRQQGNCDNIHMLKVSTSIAHHMLNT